MKSAVFYFDHARYSKSIQFVKQFPASVKEFTLSCVRFETRPGKDALAALDAATPKEGETVLNSVLLEE